ncbi:MAG: hypothetical protein HW373_1327 [Deltaproteobacteria bacterium]|nr:hypothetical protein [Deltaproteobacteria bacterium]
MAGIKRLLFNEPTVPAHQRNACQTVESEQGSSVNELTLWAPEPHNKISHCFI